MLTFSALFVEIDENALPQKRGETSISENRFVIGCPCGCGSIISIRFAETEHDKGVCWLWNNDRVRPTLIPSIQVLGGCGWHGYLVDGEYREC